MADRSGEQVTNSDRTPVRPEAKQAAPAEAVSAQSQPANIRQANGHGAIRQATEGMVATGALAPLEVGTTPGSGSRNDAVIPATQQERADRLRQLTPESFVSQMGNSDKFFKNVAGTVDQLGAAKPEDQATVFSQAVQQFRNDPENANVTPAVFMSVLGSALAENKSTANLRTEFYGNVGLLRSFDGTNGTSSRIVGMEYAGRDANERQAFDTGMALAKQLGEQREKVPPGQAAEFDNTTDRMLTALNENKLLMPNADKPARERPNDGKTEEQRISEQALALDASFPSLLSGITPEARQQLTKTLAGAANDIAFAKPADMQNKFSAAMNSLAEQNPQLNSIDASRMMMTALANASGSKDFDVRSEPHDPDIAFLRDKTVATKDNPGGIVAGATFDPSATELQRQAFAAASGIAATIRASSAGITSDVERERFVGNVFEAMQLRATADKRF